MTFWNQRGLGFNPISKDVIPFNTLLVGAWDSHKINIILSLLKKHKLNFHHAPVVCHFIILHHTYQLFPVTKCKLTIFDKWIFLACQAYKYVHTHTGEKKKRGGRGKRVLYFFYNFLLSPKGPNAWCNIPFCLVGGMLSTILTF